MMSPVKFAAVCCLSMAYLTAAAKLPHSRGYSYQAPSTTPRAPPTYYVPSAPPQQSYIPPQPQPSPAYVPPPQASYSQPQPTYSKPEPVYMKPMPFAYGYGVEDEQNGIEFGHSTNSNGEETTGEYRVLLPDGRTQIVTYNVDDNGYKAEVTYEGEARPYEAPQTSYQEQPSHQTNTYQEPQQPHQGYNIQPPQTSYVPPQHSAPSQSSYSTPIKPDTLYRSNF